LKYAIVLKLEVGIHVMWGYNIATTNIRCSFIYLLVNLCNRLILINN